MEYKKVEKISRREEIRQFNNSNILTESVGICRISQTSDSKELKNNTEDTDIQNSADKILLKQSSAIEVIKDSNFDNEDEWDIDGIPELLNELDADIEKSLKNIQTSRSESKKNVIELERNNSHTRKGTTNIPKIQNCSKSNISFQRNSQLTLSVTSNNKSASTFAGFSKGGHLISTSPNSSFFNTTKLYSCKEIKTTKNFSRKDCIFSMSSQSGNNGNPSSNLSGTGLSNLNSVSSISSSNNSNKSNNKMSIDHQATLDKGLKMKIKRTKPGTKSSEAKHEIVKAIEQQQNGLVGGGNSACSGNQEDITCVISVSNQAANSQNSNMTLGINNSQVNSNVTNNKKNLGSGINQTNNSLCNSGNISLGNSVSSSINSSQSSVQGTKRGSSSHRRDKTKEKSSHSNRLGIEKNSSNCTEKESSEKVTCHCVGTDANISNSSNCSCNRKTETNTLTQRLTTQNTSSNTTTVPPGVFTPSAESSNAGASGLLAVTTTISTPITTQTTSSSINANAPGPPTKEVSINSGSNIKISSHIAAQLAAAAASTNSANGSNITTSTIPNSDMKTSASNTQQIGKHLPSGQISSTAHHSLSSSNNKSVTSTVADSMSSNISSNEISESPPPKRIKHLDNNIAESSNKEMIDMCIGTSVGTITEPECLGPCEPGTSVTLEGIVWHETEGGVLVVNVTWRGKTYVGTLLDCTRHDWAPPRFCDSPTDDLDNRTPKGRGKRGRATITPDLSNFTETRSSIYFSHSHVHSKLRNGSNKGGRGTSRTTSVPPVEKNNSGSSFSSGNGGSTPSTSPTAFLPPRAEKRKSKDESPPPVSQNNESSSAAIVNASGIAITSSGGLTSQTQSFINPVTGLNVQINTKRCKTSSPCAISPVLLECPEQDCSKKYKHVNGLRYHQSHAHGSATLLDEDSMAETEEHATPQPSPVSSTPTPSMTPNPSDILLNTQITISQQLENSESNTTKLEDEKLPLQLENFEKDSTSETASSLPGEDILTESNNKKVSTINSSSSISITSGTSHNETQKQFLDMVGNKISTSHHSQETNSQLTPHSPTGKSGVLRFGQIESTTASLTTSLTTETLSQVKSDETVNKTDLTEKCAASHQEANKDTNSNEVLEKPTLQDQNNKNIVICKDLTPNSVVSKPKKGRKTPTPTDYDTVEVNACNISSREDVQSPAYSDISDDSAPVNESDILDKGTVSKNPEILKKSADVGLSPSATCPTNPNNMPSTLGSYGVYQFYQQQQFIVPSADQQSSEKNMLSPNNTTISPSLPQQGVSEYNAKKDPSLDLISKGNTNQHCPEISKDCSRPICVTSSQGNSEMSNISSIGALTSTAPSKNVSHFYAFNYMPPNYPFNVDSNYGSSSVPVEDNTKQNRLAAMSSPSDQSQQHSSGLLKDDRSKDDNNSAEAGKPSNPQISTKPTNKPDSMVKSECVKQESSLPQIPQHMPIQSKEHQGIGAYTNIYQRHPLTLASQQLSREEELRRYYIFSDQQRRQNSSSQNPINQQLQNASQPGNQQCKDDPSSSLGQHIVQSQQQIKIKSNTSLNINKSGNSVVSSKESPKHKQEEEIKVIKQEGQKPTMETQGPPPPPTSQYFLHPSYITSTPFGFDPSHPMYRNVLMPASSPYNTPPYHLPMPRYHAPEDLSRNTGTKALDALHHAASQYYTTHKIHELSERALKSPNNNNSNNSPGTIKISGTSPNIGTSQHSNMCSNIITNHSVPNQTVNVSQIQHNISTQGIAISNKQDGTGQKTHPNGTSITGTPLNEQQKPQVSVNSTISCTGNGNNNVANSISNLSTSDSRSPPPQRHVHTHHHTHVGLGYPMYPAPYGAAVLASQQAAAVAVINPFPTGPNK